jgi:hypothetical protein
MIQKNRRKNFLSEANNRLSASIAVALAFLFYIAIIVVPGSSVLKDPDTFWHIRTGEWMINSGQFPVVDLYSYTSAGERWISPEWLSEILLFLAYKIGSWRGVVVLSALAIATSVGVISFYLLHYVRFSVAIGWAALTALALSSHFLARPHVFSYVLLSAWLVILLETYDRSPFRPPIPILVLLMVLWCNLHPSFTLGLFLLFVFAGYSCVGEIIRRRYVECRLPVFLVLVVSFSSLLNPYGISPTLLTLDVVHYHFALRYISEWASPNFQSDKIHLVMLVGLFSAMAGLGLQLKGPRLIAFAAVTYLGMSHTRGLTTFFLLAPLILARPLSEQIAWCRAEDVGDGRLPGRTVKPDPILLFVRRRHVAIPSILLVLASIATATSWRYVTVRPDESIAPKEAIEFVRKEGISGNVLNSYAFGGYLIFSHIPTFVDGRMLPFSDDFIRRFAGAIALDDINDSFKLLEDYYVRWTLLLPGEPLVKALAESKSWDKVYADEHAIVFVRR